jgi:hypothetical protein
MTGRVPNNPSMNDPNASNSQRQGQAGFFNPFGDSSGFGRDSLFNDNRNYASSSRFDSWDPFANDPFLNQRSRRGGNGTRGFGRGNFFDDIDDMLQGFPGAPHPSPFASMFGGGGFGTFGAHFGPSSSAFHSFAQQMDPNQRAMNDQSTRNDTGRSFNMGGSYSFSFSSSSSSSFRDGKWTSVSHEESNMNGDRKRQSQRTWTDDDVSET